MLHMGNKANCVWKEQILQQEWEVHHELFVGHWVMLGNNNNNKSYLDSFVEKFSKVKSSEFGLIRLGN